MRISAIRYAVILLGMSGAIFTMCFTSAAQSGIPTRTEESNPAQPTAVQIVSAMMTNNQSRAAAMSGYTGDRTYHLSYRGYGSEKDAEVVVKVSYRPPSKKEFTVISESGSRVIIDKVLKRLLTSENEAQSADNQRATALSPQNYRFELEGEETTGNEHYYRLKVQPLRNNKFLYRGIVWVDGKDFAIARIEAEPAENPSFWISHTEIQQQYAKVGSFWLPVRNRSTSKVRLGGTATLTIEYSNYRLNSDDARQANAAALISIHAADVPGVMFAGRDALQGPW